MITVEQAIDGIKRIKIGFFNAYIDRQPIGQFLDAAITALEAQKDDMWIPISSGRLPENEKEVDITVERRFKDGDKRVFTCRAIYEDGTVWSEDSIYNWENFDNEPYDYEKEDFKVPQGWFEAVSYVEESHVIDDFVIAWKPIAKPWKDEQS